MFFGATHSTSMSEPGLIRPSLPQATQDLMRALKEDLSLDLKVRRPVGSEGEDFGSGARGQILLPLGHTDLSARLYRPTPNG